MGSLLADLRAPPLDHSHTWLGKRLKKLRIPPGQPVSAQIRSEPTESAGALSVDLQVVKCGQGELSLQRARFHKHISAQGS